MAQSTSSAFLDEPCHESIEIVFNVNLYAVQEDNIPQAEHDALNARLRVHQIASRGLRSCKEADAFIRSATARALASEGDHFFSLEKTRVIAGAKDAFRPSSNFVHVRVWAQPQHHHYHIEESQELLFDYDRWCSIRRQYKEPSIQNRLRVTVELWPKCGLHQRRLALAMATDPRLGADSPLRLLDKEVLGLILDELLEYQ